MIFGLQMGHGMQGLITEFLDYQQTNNPVILSPRNFGATKNKSAVERLVYYSQSSLQMQSKEILLDPQLFSEKSFTKSLQQFPHWEACGGNFKTNVQGTLATLAELNRACGTDTFIIPSQVTERIDSQWIEGQADLAEIARAYANGRTTLITVALGNNVLKSDTAIDEILFAIEKWDTEGIYLVSEHPNNEYLVREPLWLYNLMSIVAGAKRSGKRVYVGYGSHQMLSLCLAGCDVLFSGNHLNLRRFEKATFEKQEQEQRTKTTWYYAPQALSEFKVSTLDLAYSVGKLEFLKSPFDDDEYVGMLFHDGMPSDTAYDDKRSFMHYLISLNKQCALFYRESYSDTLNTVLGYYSTAESLLEGLSHSGIIDKGRNFAEALPATSQAIIAFNENWGFSMRQEWSDYSR